MESELLERASELGLLRAGLDRAEDGQGGLLIVEGSAGAGKSSLLRAVRDQARDRAVTVRQAGGGPLEQDHPFGVVRQLLEPLVRAADEARRARLLAGAAALAAPVIGVSAAGEEPPGADDAFATLHGLYWLTAAFAEEQPLLLVVDDAQWADEPSARYLDFLGRRVSDLAVLVVVAFRPDEPGAVQDLLAGLGDGADAQVMRPAPLSTSGATHLIAQATGAEVAGDVAAAAHAATGGNPLLVRELALTLAEGGGTPTVGAVHEAAPATVTRSVRRRLGRLPGPATAVAEAVAVLGDGRSPDLLAQAVAIPPEECAAALDRLRASGLIEGDPPGFRHPLIGQSIAAGVGAERRTVLHHSAARALRDTAGAEDEVLAHLLASSPLHEPWVVPALRAGARRAMAEAAPGVAARRLGRALEMTSADDPDRDGLALELALAEARAGDPAGGTRLVELSTAPDPGVSATALATRLATGFRGTDERAEAVAAKATALLDVIPDAETKGRLRAQLYSAFVQNPSLTPARKELVEGITRDDPLPLVAALTWERVCTGATRDEVLGLVRFVAAERPTTRLAGVEQPFAFWSLIAAIHVDGGRAGEEMIRDAEETARRHGSRLARGFALFMRARWSLELGSMVAAEDAAREALAYFVGPAFAIVGVSTTAALALALTRRGELEAADALLRTLPPDDVVGEDFSGGASWDARARLRMAQGRPGDALADLDRLDDLTSRFGWRRFAVGNADTLRAAALARAGRRGEAAVHASAALADAEDRGVPAAAAEALMAQAAASDGRAAVATLEAAVAAAGESESLHVRAEALAHLGAALRRAGLRRDAREPLTRARELAHRIAATPIESWTTTELALAGARPRRIALTGVESLTPSERRIAAHAARGLTNREIAETLFVTRKTVETTLGNVFAKLGIHARTELPASLAGETPAPRDG